MNNSQLSGIRTPHDNDVLSGRGNYANRHPGNKRFRAYVSMQRELYAAAPKNEKNVFAKTIVSAIRNQLPPGRFLKRDPDTELWVDIGNRKSQLKTRQALREMPSEIGRASRENHLGSVNIANPSCPLVNGSTMKPTTQERYIKHVKDCCNEDCKNKCYSSIHGMICCETSKQNLGCKLSVPVINHIVRYSSSDTQIMSKRSDQKAKVMGAPLYHLNKNISSFVDTSKQEDTKIQWDKSAREGQEKMLNGSQQAYCHRSRKPCKNGEPERICTPDCSMLSQLRNVRPSLSDIDPIFKGGNIIGEDREEIVGASIVLLRLKIRKLN